MAKSKQQIKDVVAGLGEIGTPILKLISGTTHVVGYDINQNLVNQKKIKQLDNIPTRFLHLCIPFNRNFEKNVLMLNQKYVPQGIVIHSTVSPGTTKKLQDKLSIPVIYSATRGIHKRMLKDLKRYTKFFAIESNAPKERWASSEYVKLMKKSNVKTKKMTNPITLELAKIVVDTSYYGWLINFAQLSNIIALKYKVNYDEMWSFAEEIQKFLGNRPKMFPGYIGGHCVIPNLDLINENTLNLIKDINQDYATILKNKKS